MKSTMFLNNITQIDHAYVLKDGKVRGESLDLACEVTGEVDEQEQVVIDFSGCKKRIKYLVDDSEFAVDHRLVAVEGLADFEKVDLERFDRFKIETPFNKIVSSVTDWVTIIPKTSDEYVECLEAYLADMLKRELAKDYPVTKVKVYLERDMVFPREAGVASTFTYVHGLRFSTSYGCQNIAHGHSSYIAIDASSEAASILITDVCNELDGAVFAYDDNVTGDDECVIAYTSQRGNFRMDTTQEVIVLPHETTVENLAEFVAKQYGNEFRKVGATRVWVSEGLSKGAVVDL